MFVLQPGGRLTMSSAGRLVHVDDAALALFGFDSRDEMLQAPVESLLLTPGFRTRDVAHFVGSLPLPRVIESPCRRRDGSTFAALLVFRIPAQGDEIAIEVEDPQSPANRVVASVLDALPVHVFIKDRQHRSLFANRRFCELTGLSREQMRGKTDHEFIPTAEADVFTAVDEAVFRSGETRENEEEFTDATGQTRFYLTRKSVHTEPDGQQILLGVATDITERKEMEQALRLARDELESKVEERTRELNVAFHQLQRQVTQLESAEARYRAVFEATGTANLILDRAGTITLANEAFAHLVGRTRVELVGRSLAEFVDDSLRERVRRQLAAEDDEARELEVRVRGAGGVLRDGIVTLSVIPPTRERLVSFLDVTERKRADEQMFRAEKMAALGQIIAGVAHEINNPNNFIYFNLPILRRYIDAMRPFVEERLAAEPGLRLLNMPAADFIGDMDRLIENMQHGSRRITGIVGELRNYIRRQEAEERRAERVEAVIDRVMTIVGKQVRKMVKRLDVDIEGPLPAVVMNAGRIEQVLINLVLNAGQAADKDDSWVRLSARAAAPDRVAITIADNGCGIGAEAAPHVFDPFFTTKGREGGTGLGLAIAQRIVTEHGGTIELASTPGEGSSFTVVLPTAPEGQP